MPAPELTLEDLIADLKRASVETPPPIFDKWLYKKAAEFLAAAHAAGMEEAAKIAETVTTVKPNWGTREAIAAAIRARIKDQRK